MIISDIEINPNNRDVILAGTGNDRFVGITLGDGVGVLKSTDGGQTWYQTSFRYPLEQNVLVAFKVCSGNLEVQIVFIWSPASNGVWLSTDSGENWSLLKSGRSSALVIDELSPHNLYTIIRAVGVFPKSTNAG